MRAERYQAVDGWCLRVWHRTLQGYTRHMTPEEVQQLVRAGPDLEA